MGSTRAWIGCLAHWHPKSDVDQPPFQIALLLQVVLQSLFSSCGGLMLGTSACSVVGLGSVHLER